MRTAALSAALLLAGCTSNAALERAVEGRRAERERLTRIAETLDTVKAQVVALEPVEQKARIWRAGGDAGAALKVVGEASESPVGFKPTGDGRSRFTLGGRGGAAGMARALERLAAVAPGFLFVTASSDASGAWTIEVESRDAWMPPLTVENAVRNTPPIPRGGSKALHAEVARLDREIAELGRLAAEVGKFEERIAITEHERARANAPDSVGGVTRWISDVFGPVLSSGSASLANGTLSARGTMSKGVDAGKLATLARGKFEIVSVAPPHAEVARAQGK